MMLPLICQLGKFEKITGKQIAPLVIDSVRTKKQYPRQEMANGDPTVRLGNSPAPLDRGQAMVWIAPVCADLATWLA
jgi:hypothetical protein